MSTPDNHSRLKVAYGSVPKDGGTFTFYRNLRPALAQHGIDLICVTVGASQAAQIDLTYADSGCVVLAPNERDPLQQSRRFVQWCKDQGIHIVIGVNSLAILSAIPHLPPAIRVVARCANGFERGYRVTLEGLDRIARIIAVAPRLQTDLITTYGVDAQLIRTIVNGVDERRFSASTERKPGPPIKLAFVGRLEHSQKGIFHLPPVMDALHSQGVDFRLTLAGAGRDEAVLRRRLKHHAQAGRVDFAGRLPPEKIAALLQASDALLLTSHFEGCPNVLLEALTAGCIPVAWRLPGITDHLIRHGETGYLQDVGDHQGLALCLGELAAEPALRARLSSTAAQDAADRFTASRTAAEYAEELHAVMASTPPSVTPRPWSSYRRAKAFDTPLSERLKLRAKRALEQLR